MAVEIPQSLHARPNVAAPLLPGLTRAEPHGLAALLEAYLVPGVRLVEVRLVRAKLNAEKGNRSLYLARLAAGSAQLEAYFFSREATAPKGERLATRINLLLRDSAATNPYFVSPAFYLPEIECLIQIFPADIRLPTLVKAVDPNVIEGVLNRLSWSEALAGKLRVSEVDVVQYKPERKAVLRYVVASDSSSACPYSVYGKIRKGHGQVGSSKLEQIHRAYTGTELRLPQPLGVNSGLSLELTRAMEGDHFSRFHSDNRFPDLCAKVARGLRDLHQTAANLNDRRTIAQCLDQVTALGERLSAVIPRYHARIARIITDCCRRLADPAVVMTGLVHGDFHVANLLLAGDTLSLLDFDDAYLGDPAADVGSFFAQLKLLSLKVFGDPTRLDPGVGAFLDEYVGRIPGRYQTVIAAHCAYYALWCAYHQCLLRPRRNDGLTWALVMMEVAEEALWEGRYGTR